jgi:hypothetical protein
MIERDRQLQVGDGLDHIESRKPTYILLVARDDPGGRIYEVALGVKPRCLAVASLLLEQFLESTGQSSLCSALLIGPYGSPRQVRAWMVPAMTVAEVSRTSAVIDSKTR